jgi:hypothetical protein
VSVCRGRPARPGEHTAVIFVMLRHCGSTASRARAGACREAWSHCRSVADHTAFARLILAVRSRGSKAKSHCTNAFVCRTTGAEPPHSPNNACTRPPCLGDFPRCLDENAFPVYHSTTQRSAGDASPLGAAALEEASVSVCRGRPARPGGRRAVAFVMLRHCGSTASRARAGACREAWSQWRSVAHRTARHGDNSAVPSVASEQNRIAVCRSVPSDRRPPLHLA